MSVYHCRSCAARPRANLTFYESKLWRPECLLERPAVNHVEPGVLEQSRASETGLVVVEGGRRRKRTRADVVRDAKGVLR